jgi:hypothetical protein
MAAYTRCLRCAGAPRRPASGPTPVGFFGRQRPARSSAAVAPRTSLPSAMRACSWWSALAKVRTILCRKHDAHHRMAALTAADQYLSEFFDPHDAAARIDKVFGCGLAAPNMSASCCAVRAPEKPWRYLRCCRPIPRSSMRAVACGSMETSACSSSPDCRCKRGHLIGFFETDSCATLRQNRRHYLALRLRHKRYRPDRKSPWSEHADETSIHVLSV